MPASAPGRARLPARPVLACLLALAAGCDAGAAREDPAEVARAAEPVWPLDPAWRTSFPEALVELVLRHARRVEQDPGAGGRIGTLGLVYRANGLWPEAREAFARARALDPTDPLWLDQLADAEGELGRAELAAELLEEGAEAFPEHPPTLHRLGLARLHQGRFEEALQLFERVIRRAPSSAEGHLGAGAAELELGAPQAARRALERALELAPDERAGHYLLGRALRELGLADEALAHLQRGRGGALDPLPDAADLRLGRFAVGVEHRRQRATRALASGRPEQALELLETLWREHPGEASVALDLGVARSRLGRPEQALEAFRAAAALEPEHHLVHANLSACLLDLGRPGEALAAAERALELAPELAAGHVMQARALETLGRPDEARAALERAAELDPGDRLVRRALEESGPADAGGAAETPPEREP